MAGPPVSYGGIWDFNAANPRGTEAKSFGDDWFRFIQDAVKLTFGNVTAPVTATAAELNQGVPIGTIAMWGAGTPPTGWIFCQGQSTTPYPELAAIYGSNVPDMRGEFVRGSDGGKGVDPGRLVGTFQDHDIKEHRHISQWANHNAWTPEFGLNDRGNLHSVRDGGQANNNREANAWVSGVEYYPTGSAPAGSTLSETRPRNVALHFIIKAERL